MAGIPGKTSTGGLATRTSMSEDRTTHFGYQRVNQKDKARKVADVFSSVATRYDLMNDVMSLGIHRLWKRYAIHTAAIKQGDKVLDLAGGTGDLSALIYKKTGPQGKIVLADINGDMLNAGRDKQIDQGQLVFDYVQANAECLPFKSNSFNFVSIAFGLRNVTDKQKALESMFDVLAYGSQVMILEFSHLILPKLKKLYDEYSFRVIPLMGQLFADDKESYQYLVESIRMHPDQETLKEMMVQAGFSRVEYRNLSAGVVAIHTAYKI